MTIEFRLLIDGRWREAAEKVSEAVLNRRGHDHPHLPRLGRVSGIPAM